MGNSFDNPKGAFDDERRLPRIIAMYEADLVKMETTGEFAGRTDNIDEMITQWKNVIADYKVKWANVRHLSLDKFTEPE